MKNYFLALAIAAITLNISSSFGMFYDPLFEEQIYNNLEQEELTKLAKLREIKLRIKERKSKNNAASQIQHAWKSYKIKKLTRENECLLKRVKQLEAFKLAIKNTSINAENFEYHANLALQAVKRGQQLMDTLGSSLDQ